MTGEKRRIRRSALSCALGVLLAGALLLDASVPRARATRQSGEDTDVAALLLEVALRERALTARRLEYTWTTKVTYRELNKRGEVSKQSESVYEVYPVRGEFARKLVSKDGVKVSQKRAADELKKTAEQLEKAARDEQKRAEAKPTPPPAPAETQNPAGLPAFGFSTGNRESHGLGSHEISLAVWRFFRYAEFTRPRREQLRGRACIVLDFRPRRDFRPADEIQKPYARLAGRLWIDAADRMVARLEAWPDDTRDAAVTTAPEPLVVFEHERLPDGVWLEHLVRIETYGHKEIFNGIELDFTKECTDFRRFTADPGDDKLDAPKARP